MEPTIEIFAFFSLPRLVTLLVRLRYSQSERPQELFPQVLMAISSPKRAITLSKVSQALASLIRITPGNGALLHNCL